MTWPDTIVPEVRLGVKRAVAWRTLTEIVRHHPTLDLRVVETHPGDGQYDCLTLVRGPSFTSVCQFNLVGTGLALGQRLGPPRALPGWLGAPLGEQHVWRYPQHGLGEDRGALALALEARLGFPVRAPGDPPVTRPGLALGVVAELLDRVALGTRAVDVRCGWFDTPHSVGVRPWAADKPGVGAVPEAAPWRARARAACRFWGIDREVECPSPAVVVDVATTGVWVRGEARGSLAERYAAGVRAMAWELEGGLEG